MACTWRIVVDIEDAEDNWMVAYQADRMTNVEQYISALYWSVMTITTIGYGDVVRSICCPLVCCTRASV